MSYQNKSYYAPKLSQPIKFSLLTATGVYNKVEIVMPKSEYVGLVPGIAKIELRIGADVATHYQKWHLSTTENGAIQTPSSPQVISAGMNLCTTLIGNQDYTVTRDYQQCPIPITVDKIWFGAIQDTTASITYEGTIWFVPCSAPGIQQQQQVANYVAF